MTRFASVARVAMFATLGVVLASACGGQSFTNNGGGDAGSGASDVGGSGNAGGSTKGGSTSRAGNTGTAGKGHAGTGAGGGSAGSSIGGTGAGATGGGPSEGCVAAPSSGNCDAYIPSWYNDPSTGICRPFVYGGCGGNANRYPSLEACQQACPGGSPNYDTCKFPSDCLITGTGCCGVCDSPNITAQDLIAYNRQYAGLLQCGVALDIAAGGAASAGAAAPIACAPCPPPEGQGTLQYFMPTCLAGQCAVTDLRTSDATVCNSSNDCKLRRGTSCCEGCSTNDLVAVRKDGSFEKLACGAEVHSCPACPAPAPATDAVAVCGASGHCEVAVPLQAAQ